MIKEIIEFAGEYRATAIKKLMGREGSGWSATILRNGKELGTAADYGDGGAIRIYIIDKQEKDDLDKFAKTRSNDEYEPTECFLDDLVNYELFLKKLKTSAKKQLVSYADLVQEKDPNNIDMSYSIYKCEDNPANRKAVEAKYPGVKFLNDDIGLIDIPKVKKLKIK